ncbi:glycosyltransferase family 2 protein [Ferruginibacter albus]|uniref:glycosyltransferase family 2 protein n=1 Tax=Ferruginibacter albus TaxID=2875540 RepID=UPI001CC71B18|nr:glycosyltransferase family 2 protein [Ferruginibacter albus]UAY50697.1 glycosyltransferase family 2 protein [Ferruginibacter albus]
MMLSVIIPTYNRSELLDKTLKSIEFQSYSNWECIIVDDHSQDNTQLVAQEYVNRDARFKLITNQRKKGAQGARNTGLIEAKGEYISFFDSDNLMSRERYEKQLKFFERDVTIDACTCYSHLLNDSNDIVGAFIWITKGDILKKLLEGHTYVDYNSTVIKKNALNKIGLLDEDCPSYQEWDTFIRLSHSAKFETDHELLVDYYQRSVGRISNDSKKELRGQFYIYKKHAQLFIDTLGKDFYFKKLSSIYRKASGEDALLQNEIVEIMPELKDSLLLLKVKQKIKKLWK